MTLAEPALPPVFEPSLLQQCVAGDRSAWRELHRQHFGLVWSFLVRLGVPSSNVDDVAQDVFIAVFRGLRGFRGDANFKTWLYKVCVTYARRYRRRARTAAAFISLFSERPAPDALAGVELPASTPGRILAALAQLSDVERETFVLYELEGVQGKDIAALLGCPETTVWRRLHYGRAKFEQAVRSESARTLRAGSAPDVEEVRASNLRIVR